MYDVIRNDVKKYGKVYGTFRFTSPSLMVADAEVAKDVLIKQFGNFSRRSIESPTGDQLWDNIVVHLPHDQWRTVTTLMGCAFTLAKMRGMIPKANTIASRYTKKLSEVSKSTHNEIDLKHILYGYSMDSIVAVSFGIDINNLENPDNDFVKHGSQLFKPGVSLFVGFILPQLVRYLPFIDFPPRATTKFFETIGKRIIAEKRRNLDEVMKNGAPDILDLHLIAQKEDPKNHITDEVLASQAFLFFSAGIDPITLLLELCTYFLAINPKVQGRVYDEIKHIMGKRTEIHYDDVQKMQLLEACLLKSVRIVPILFSIDRIAAKDTEVAGIPIKKGTVVEFPLAYLQHDPIYFPEPEKFIPDRFLKNGDVKSEIAAFLTFGDGPKACIGRRLALMLSQVLIVDILLKVKLEQCQKTPVPLQLKPGFNINDIFLKPLILRCTPRSEEMP